MIKINLIPREALEEEAKKDLLVYGIILGIIFVIILVVISAYNFVVLSTVNQRIAIAKDNLKKYEAVAQQVDQLQNDKSVLERRKTIVEGLVKNRLLYSVFLYDFAVLIPDKAWVQNIGTNVLGDNVVSLDVTAKSFSSFAIADWIVALENSGKFTVNDVGRISVVSGPNDQKLYNFTLKLTYTKAL